MSLEAIQQVLGVLQAASGVTVLVSTRISPLNRPQGDPLPAITLNRISVLPNNGLAGDENLDQARLQLDCWGATYADARAVANAVRAAMRAVQILMMSERDGFDVAPNPGVYQIIQEYSVWS